MFIVSKDTLISEFTGFFKIFIPILVTNPSAYSFIEKQNVLNFLIKNLRFMKINAKKLNSYSLGNLISPHILPQSKFTGSPTR